MYANSGINALMGAVQERMFLVDIGHGDTVMIEIRVEDPARWDAVLAEAMSIVESMQFAEPAASD
jgi:hypothetical protein